MENFTRELEPIKTVKWMVLCGDLNGKEIQKRGDIYICIADSFGCTVETNTTL